MDNFVLCCHFQCIPEPWLSDGSGVAVKAIKAFPSSYRVYWGQYGSSIDAKKFAFFIRDFISKVRVK